MIKRIQIEISKFPYEISYNDDKISYYNSVINANIVMDLKKYPFRCPEIFINNCDYKKLVHSYFTVEISSLYGKNCMCCDSLTCEDNWHLLRTLKDINDEIEKSLKTKRRAIDLFLMKKINIDLPLDLKNEFSYYL